MAYKRRGYKKRYSNRRRYTRKSTWGSVAQKALRTANYVAKLVNAEYKHVDAIQASGNITNAGTIGIMAVPIQGVGSDQRTGDSIKVKNCAIRGTINRNGADAVVRLIMFWDKSGQINTPGDFIEQVGNTLTVVSPRNEDLKYEAKTLFDFTVRITADNPIGKFDKVVKVSRHMNFATNSGSPEQGILKFLYISNVNANYPTIDFFARTTYLDN